MKLNNKVITLRRINRRNYREIINLKVKPHQNYLIASNAVSMADAYFYKEAWMRGIYCGEILLIGRKTYQVIREDLI